MKQKKWVPGIGKRVTMRRPLQNRTAHGTVFDIIIGVKPTQVLCEFGGDEFVEICTLTDERGVLEVVVSGTRVTVES